MTIGVRSSLRSGFSLMEILIALAILGIILAATGPAIYNFLAGAKKDTTKTTLKSLKTIIGLYQGQVGQYPQTLKDLIKEPQGARGWHGPYIDKSQLPEDGWGNPFSYKITPGGKHPYELFSYGPNSKGSPKEEHISVWEDEQKEK